MSPQGQLIIAGLSMVVLAYVIWLTVRGLFSERWCLFWLGISVLGAVLVCVPWLLSHLVTLVGAVFPASALTMVAVFCLVILAIHANSEATIHSRQITILIQQLAIMRLEFERRGETAVSDDFSTGSKPTAGLPGPMPNLGDGDA